MAVAVTGASGYIGRALVAHFARQGIDVVGVSRSKAPSAAFAGVKWLVSPDGIPSAPQLAGCEAVVHLAGRAHTTIAFENGHDLFDMANHQLAVQTAAVAHQAGVRRFVFVSTIGVHGSWADATVHEDSPVRADTPYARSKWSAEQTLLSMCAMRSMALCIVRPPMVYGPDCPGNFARLVKLVMIGLPLPFASVDAQRSFIHVDNLASFLSECAMHAQGRQAFVIGDGSDWALPQLVHAIGSGVKVATRLFPFPPVLLRIAAGMIGRRREFDSLTRPMKVDSTRARLAFSWSPSLQASDALRQTLKSYDA